MDDNLKKLQQDLENAKKMLNEKTEEFRRLQNCFCTLTSKLNVMQELQQLLISFFDREKLFSRLLEIIQKTLNVESISILLVDESREKLYFAAALGPKSEEVKKYKLNLGEGIAGWVFAQNEAVAISDVNRDARFKKDITEAIGYEVHSLLAVPLKIKGRVEGVIEVLNKQDNDMFLSDDIDLLTAIANFSGIIIENNRLIEKGKEKVKKKIKKVVSEIKEKIK